MRLTLVISSLSSGGAERVISTMANYWAAKDWSITLLTLDANPPFYELDRRVLHIPLGMARESSNAIVAIRQNLKRIRVLRRAIQASRPYGVISLTDKTNVLTLLATRGLGITVIVSERIDPWMYSIGRFWGTLRRWLYPYADQVVVQSESALRYFSPSIQRVSCIVPNPVSWPGEFQGTLDKVSARHMPIALGMGRLEEQKGFDLLLQAFAQIASDHPDWLLEIWGEGSARPALERLRHGLQLNERVRLPGKTRQPFQKMQAADLFVLSSRFEGFPNVLCEAMAFGLPAISFDCLSGPRQIIRDGTDGILVPPGDVEALAAAMHRLMSEPTLRQRLAARAPEVLERFGLERVMGMWEEILQQVSKRRL
jgi:GalNAc-alpha-(1->4)-GalNAc-alpha-(1->3)-diNAcBac-PP-undecaprenol alpha-1,4-N-acetyl-D-galactosaminyltransferase